MAVRRNEEASKDLPQNLPQKRFALPQKRSDLILCLEYNSRNRLGKRVIRCFYTF